MAPHNTETGKYKNGTLGRVAGDMIDVFVGCIASTVKVAVGVHPV